MNSLPICLLAFAVGAPAAVTFHKDVLPILQAKCQGCHRPGEIGPMSFMTYTSTRPWAKAIRQAVLAKKMPPWFADGPHGKFANDPSLQQRELDVLSAWADGGAPEGSPSDAPAPLSFVDGWNIGTPHAVIAMPEPFAVPASGVVEYQHIVVPTGFKEDRWVEAAEIRPGSRDVVHHVVVFSRPPGSTWFRDAQPGVPVTRDPTGARFEASPPALQPEFLLSYTPGRPPTRLQKGQARLVKAGSDLIFQLHYTTNGKAVRDQSKIGLIFAAEPPTERVATLFLANRNFVIPPGQPSHLVDLSASVNSPARMLRLIPHMHLRGKAFEVNYVPNGGAPERLLNVPRYDFRWQNAYVLAKPVELKPGDRLELSARFDNSPNNPFNPDAKAEVRWGDQSFEEMMVNYVDVAVPANVEPKGMFRTSIPTIREKFLGVWKLKSYERRYQDGRITYPFGKNATGRITYDRAGRMSAQLINPDRQVSNVIPGGLAAASEADLREILRGAISYYGTFTVNEAKGVVVHKVESCTYPSWIGTDLVRAYHFEPSGLLALKVAQTDGESILVWEKEPD